MRKLKLKTLLRKILLQIMTAEGEMSRAWLLRLSQEEEEGTTALGMTAFGFWVLSCILNIKLSSLRRERLGFGS